MTNHKMPEATASATMHAERIRAREKSAERDVPAGGQSTAELYAARILPGYKRDEELREQARLNEMRARGRWVPGDDVDEDGEEYEQVEEEYEDEEPEDDGGEQLSTAEKYAAIETERRRAERAATLAAHKSVVRTIEPQGHRYAAQLAQPHRLADRWQKPAS
jgi:hypothetical protein